MSTGGGACWEATYTAAGTATTPARSAAPATDGHARRGPLALAPLAVAAVDVDRSRVADVISLDALAGGAALFHNATDPGPGWLGDCDDDGAVAIDELVRSVGIALAQGSVAECLAADSDDSADVAINELIAAVRSALEGC